MSRVAVRVVLIASALLPGHQRARYREQWLGELRDAPTLGVRTSDIALGSLAFVATSARPLPTGRRLSAEMISRRARLAIALSGSAAALAISQYASAPISAPTSTDLAGSTIATLTLMLTLYSVLSPFVATLIALATRGMSRGVRIKVVLLSLACAAPLALSAIRNQIQSSPYGFYVPIVTTFLPAAFALAALVVFALWRGRRPLDPAAAHQPLSLRMLQSTFAGVAVALMATAGFVGAINLWNGRTPLVFHDAVTGSLHTDYKQWLTFKATVEHMVTTTLVAWLIVGLVIACAVVVFGVSRHSTARSAWVLAVGAVSAIGVSFGAVAMFLEEVLPSVSPSFPIDLATVLGQLGLVVAILFGVTAPSADTPGGLVKPTPIDPAPSING